MKKVELKRIAEFLWKGTPANEKTPFSSQGSVSDHGTISKNLEAGDNEKSGKEFSDDEKDGKIEGPMSIPRKLCFAMSFNVWILYFLMLGWIIPCRDFNCDSDFNDVWERNLANVWPLTNLETLNVDNVPSLVMLGYADGPALSLVAMDTKDGIFKWNNSLTFIPRRIQCNFEIKFDVNRDGISDCLLTGYNDVYAFNASNGHVFWKRNLPSEEGNIISRFHPTVQRYKLTYLIGTCGNEIVVLNAQNGTEVTHAEHPCWSPFDIRVVPSVVSVNITFWSIVCDYGDKIEAWSFEEDDLLNKQYTSSDDFDLLFRRESSSGGSIDLGCDVTPIPGGPLLLSWSDRIAMVTPKTTAWEKQFPYPHSVASIKIGHFTNIKDLQIAAAVRNSTNSIVYLLNKSDGTILLSEVLVDRQVQSMEKMSGDSFDSLVLKSVVTNFTSNSRYNLTDPIPADETNFALVEFRKNVPVIKDIVTTSTVLGSAINVKEDGETNLLLLKTEDGIVVYQKYVIHRSKKDNLFCSGEGHVTHFSSEM